MRMEKVIDTKKYPLFFLIPAAVGIFFLIFGLSIVWSNKKRAERCTEEVSGVVLQMLERDGNNGHLYTPVFEYSFGGKIFRQESDHASYPPKFSEGEEVTVMVNPGDPDDYFVTKDSAGLTMAKVFIVLGLVIVAGFVFAIFHVYLSNRDESKGKEAKGIRVGVIFLLIGLFSLAIPLYAIKDKLAGGSSNPVDYNPVFSIAMLAFCFIFAFTFIILGIVMIKKKSLGMSIGADFSAELDGQMNVRDSGDLGDSGVANSASGGSAFTLSRIFAAIGLVLVIIGGCILAYDRISIKSLVRTEALVTGTRCVSGGKSRSYYADLEYTVDGQPYQSQISVSSFFNKSNVTVWCKPDNPVVCRAKNEFILFYIILFGMGGFFFAGSLILAHF